MGFAFVLLLTLTNLLLLSAPGVGAGGMSLVQLNAGHCFNVALPHLDDVSRAPNSHFDFVFFVRASLYHLCFCGLDP